MQIVRNDITRMEVDAVVNASNVRLKKGGGVSGAIFAAAGEAILQEECDAIGGCRHGEAVLTSGFGLPSRFIIHTVGPVWKGGCSGEEEQLRSCYTSSLTLALEKGCRSVAFPLISSGIYGYPKDKALQAAVSAIGEFLMEHEMEVYLVVYDRKAFAISEKLFAEVKKYIDDNYVDENYFIRREREADRIEYLSNSERSGSYEFQMPAAFGRRRKLEDVIGHLDETFSESVLRLIDEKGMEDVETYKRANLDRKLFSKIRSSKDYQPNKKTALSLSIALGLNLDETKDLLGKAGFALSRSNKFDVVVEYFISQGRFDIFEINEALFEFVEDSLASHK
jgi:O-acetyl-ADP-ribose deacetylase (regulator of RNase III)